MDAARIAKLPPSEIYAKFSDHTICKRKCLLEKDSLKICIDTMEPR
jgi:hypothetical protein